eukprot:tig00021726_g23265.t1
MQRGDRQRARLAIEFEDGDERPPKRHDPSHLPGVPARLLHVPREPQPRTETLAEVRTEIEGIRELGGIILGDSEPRETRLEGISRPVLTVRAGPEATAEVRRIYRRHFWGPAVRMLDADDIADVLAFRAPDWARRPPRGGIPYSRAPVHLALRLRDGTCHFWNCWDAYAGSAGALYRSRWTFMMRRAVGAETDAHYEACKTAAGGRRLTCASCGAIENDEPHQVDHAGPDSFAAILLDFCRQRGLERSDGRIESKIMARKASEGEAGNYHPLLPVVLETVPPTLSADFADYHRARKKGLRILCRPCNAREGSLVPRKAGRYTIGGRLVCERNGPFDRDRPASPVRVILNRRRPP